MKPPISRIVIVGGGTAGWLTAGTIAAMSQARHEQRLSITLVESPTVPTIGVGEGTWPTMRSTLKQLGVREMDFIRRCDASFKQGAKFARWVDGRDEDFYYHPLVLPQGYFETNLVPYWLGRNDRRSFSAQVCPQEHLCEAGLAPKKITTAEYDAVANYAYHLDAGKFSAFLQHHCTRYLDVSHVLADVTGIRAAENGDIAAVITEQSGEIEGDLFVDCTGMRSLLLGGHFGIPFKSCRDVLFIDRALALQVPYPEPSSPITPYTISTAQKSGWIWDIGLQSRRGIGHVYASDYCNDELAEQRLRNYVRSTGGNPDGLSARSISIDPGHRERFWVGNCVAVGLAAGFLEPLEASAILLIEIAARFIAEQLPATHEAMQVVARRYNETFLYRWARMIDFLKLHYVLSQREDDRFWIDNRRDETIPATLKELLSLWRHQPPWHDDFDRAVEVFPAASYQYVLYGMGFVTEKSPYGLSEQTISQSEALLQRNEQETRAMIDTLIPNRDLIEKILQFGLAKV